MSSNNEPPSIEELENLLISQNCTDYDDCFNLHDKDQDGWVSTNEFPQMARQLGQIWSKEEIDNLKRELGILEITQIDRNWFIELLSRNCRVKPDYTRIDEIFDLYDRKRSKSVSIDELKHYLASFGERVDHKEFDEHFKHALTRKKSFGSSISIEKLKHINKKQFRAIFEN